MKTPGAVATVRGTTFGTENNSLTVSEGKVEVEIEGKTYTLTQGQIVHKVNGTVVQEEMSAEHKAKAAAMLDLHLNSMKEVRQKSIENQYNKYSFMIDPQLKNNDMTMQDAYQQLEIVDQTGKDVDELLEKSPVKTKPIKRIAALTKEIQEMHKFKRALNEE